MGSGLAEQSEAGPPAPAGLRAQGQTLRGAGTYTQQSGFKYCFRQVTDKQVRHTTSPWRPGDRVHRDKMAHVCLSVYLYPFYPSLYPSVCLIVCLPVTLSICLPLSVWFCPSVCLFVSSSISLSHLSVCQPVVLSVYLSVCSVVHLFLVWGVRRRAAGGWGKPGVSLSVFSVPRTQVQTHIHTPTHAHTQNHSSHTHSITHTSLCTYRHKSTQTHTHSCVRIHTDTHKSRTHSHSNIHTHWHTHAHTHTGTHLRAQTHILTHRYTNTHLISLRHLSGSFSPDQIDQ